MTRTPGHIPRPTMKDVAARAGVGLKTVSRVVNEEPGVTPGIHTAAQRLHGYREAMAAAGLVVRPLWSAMGPTTPERVGAALAAMLSGPQPVTAVLTGNNRIT